MAVFSFTRVQKIPGEPDKVWSFFADPAKLPLITPPYMQFRVLSAAARSHIYPGQLIEYKLRPLPWFQVYWMTEITHVHGGHFTHDNEAPYFVDEQRRGPYRLWHHQHHFKSISDGVEMTDIVHYEIPFGLIGKWANTLFVGRELDGLFRYRQEQIERIFGVLA